MQWRAGPVDRETDYAEPDEWTPVDVPGRPDQFADADAVAYRTTFDDPRSGAQSHAVLELRGCYAHATVWCNGDQLANHDTYFAPLRVSLDDVLTEDNDLRVVCRAPQDQFGGVHATDIVPDTDAVPGIWWDARIRAYQGTYIDSLVARPELDGEQARVTVSATVQADTDIEDRMTLSVRPEGDRRGRGMMERARIDAEPGERATVDHTISVRDPALWLPGDLGEQNRYVIRAKVAGVERTITTGFCDVQYSDERLTINGAETTARGVKLLDATVDDVERAVEANANLVRTHAHVPSKDVVDACNEAGMLLWIDMPLTGSGSFDVERGEQIATALGRHYAHVPSLSAIGIHDDPVSPFDSPLGAGFLDRLRFRWRSWRASYDRRDVDAIAAALPGSVPTFPVVGPPGIDADAYSLYPGWQYGSIGDLSWLLERYPDADVVAGFGAGALGRDGPTELAGFNRRAHDAHSDSDDVDQSQQYQAKVVKRVAEGLRNTSTSILVANALRDTGDAGMGVLTSDGTPKRAFAELKSAYEPVQASLADPAAHESDVVVHNDLDTRFTGELAWESPAASGQTDVTIGTNASATVTSIELPDNDEAVTLRLTVGDRTVENSYEM